MATHIFRSQVTVDMQGQMASIVNHWKCIDPAITDDYKLAAELVAGIAAGVAPIGFINRLVLLMSEDAFVSSIVCQQLAPTGGNTANGVYQRDDEPGGIASPWHTGQLAGVVVWVSSARPNVTGRNFIPAVPESLIDGGRFDANYKTAMDNFILTVIAGFSTPSTVFLPVIWDREDELHFQIDDGYLSLKPGTQRRREKPL
jgi:hypothetical protein